jgi:glycosyltransferase involved in cell wall biosynthesis
MNSPTTKVVIVQATIKQYRAGFFAGLHKRLAQDGIGLKVVYSEPNSLEALKRDFVEVEDGIGTKVPSDWLFSNRVVYQHAWRQLKGADLVIVEHASKHVLNYLLFASRLLNSRKVAFWGHGFHPNGTRMGKVLRQRMLHLPDWWFAYTSRTVRFLLANGVPSEIVTNVQNAIDTDGLANAAESVNEGQVAALRRSLGLPEGAPVALYCGSLYSSKHLPMLIASCALVRSSSPDFHLVVVGDGPDRQTVIDAASRYPWVHYVGPKFGEARAPYFRIADLLLNPGLVGLGILDAFAAGVPVLTTDIPIHCPEIEYLEDGYNGVITRHDVVTYADAVVGTLANQDLLAHLRQGARQSGRKYTLKNMVEHFAGGVKNCLEIRRSSPRSWVTSLRVHVPLVRSRQVPCSPRPPAP